MLVDAQVNSLLLVNVDASVLVDVYVDSLVRLEVLILFYV